MCWNLLTSESNYLQVPRPNGARLFGNKTWQALLPAAVVKVYMKRCADFCQKPQESSSERFSCGGDGWNQAAQMGTGVEEPAKNISFSLCGFSVADSLQLPGVPQ